MKVGFLKESGLFLLPADLERAKSTLVAMTTRRASRRARMLKTLKEPRAKSLKNNTSKA